MKKLLRLREVEALAAIGHSKIYRLLAMGRFPRPVRIGGRTVRWRSTDIDAWVEAPGEWEARP